MKDYQIYPLDGAGHISGSINLMRESDESALAVAESLLQPGQAAEVWQRDRKVGMVRRQA